MPSERKYRALAMSCLTFLCLRHRAFYSWNPSFDQNLAELIGLLFRELCVVGGFCHSSGFPDKTHGQLEECIFAADAYLTAPTVKPAMKRSRNRLYINAMGRLAIRQAAISAPQ